MALCPTHPNLPYTTIPHCILDRHPHTMIAIPITGLLPIVIVSLALRATELFAATITVPAPAIPVQREMNNE